MDTIVAFDFDGTLTRKNSFVQFIKFTRGEFMFYILSPIIICYWLLFRLKFLKRQKAKELVFSLFFKGMTITEFNEYCHDFSRVIEMFLKKNAIPKINCYLKNNSKIVIISASIENWIKPWATNYNITSVLATQIEINENGLITGRFRSKNCRGIEKVNRLLKDFPMRDNYKLIVYGDSSGDMELIKFADKGYWNNIMIKDIGIT